MNSSATTDTSTQAGSARNRRSVAGLSLFLAALLSLSACDRRGPDNAPAPNTTPPSTTPGTTGSDLPPATTTPPLPPASAASQ